MTVTKPIRTDADHEAALAEIRRLWDAAPGTAEADAFEVLGVLVDDYERRRWPVGRMDPVDAIRAHMAMKRLTQADLAKLLGSGPRASEILNRRRRLTVEMIARLVNEWRLPADWLVQPYELAPEAGTARRGGGRRRGATA